MMTATRKIVVFDVDGTLANNQHRAHWVRNKPKNWKAYNATMDQDSLYVDVAWMFAKLSGDCTMIVCSGRENVYRSVTEDWFRKHGLMFDRLYMRNAKDYRGDDIVKVELLEQIRAEWGDPWLWFDDRQRVVDAIRAQGVRVLQVQEGSF